MVTHVASLCFGKFSVFLLQLGSDTLSLGLIAFARLDVETLAV